MNWLEVTATLSPPESKLATANASLIETLDSLDSVLLSAIVEIESLAGELPTPSSLERGLSEIWRRCYAHYASKNEAILGKWFLYRGQSLTARIYPDADQRRRLYRSGLPPRQGYQLIQLYPTVRQHLLTGSDYATRSSEGQFEFIKVLIELLNSHPKFALAPKTPNKTTWQAILRWWLDPMGPVKPPNPTQVSAWYDYVDKNFSYRIAWGVGCILAFAANEAHGGTLQLTSLESWEQTGLPWIALWLKELIVWGTLNPVVAYLLGRGGANTRLDASKLALQYFQAHRRLAPNEQLPPTTIRQWGDSLPTPSLPAAKSIPPVLFKVKLERT